MVWHMINKIRTPKTVLTEKEMEYAKQDCLAVFAYMKDYLNHYKKNKIKKFFFRIFEIGSDPGDAGTDFDDVLGF